MKRLKYRGELIYGAINEDDPKPRWHILTPYIAGGEFTACGMAYDEIERVTELNGCKIKIKTGGTCTCEECIRVLYEWKKIIENDIKWR